MEHEMTNIVRRHGDLSMREVLNTFASFLGDKIETFGAVLVSLGLPIEPNAWLASGLLFSMAMKFSDTIRLKQLEDDMSDIKRNLSAGVKVRWTEENIRNFFVYLELYMKENFEEKRSVFKGVIRRFLTNELPVFSEDEKTFFIRVTENFSPSDIEYLTWAVEVGQFEKTIPEGERHHFFGIGRLADEDKDRYRNLWALASTGLVTLENGFDGLSFSVAPIAVRYYEFLTGKRCHSGS